MRSFELLNWSERARRPFNPALGFALAFIGCVLLVAWVRWAMPDNHTENIVASQVRLLRFVDQPDGAIEVIDAVSEQPVQRFSGEQGFLRGTLRALVRERKLRGMAIVSEQPFELIAHDGGRLTLRDPATGSSIALESFGSSNVAVFTHLMR